MIWLPSKPSSMRTRSSANADDLREDAVDGVGMDERDLLAEEAPPRPLVDQLGTLGGELVECGADVVDLERDVVHPGTALREELADGRVLAERGQQLDAVGADPQRRRFHALLLDGLAVLELGAEEPLVGRERLVEVVDRNTEVVDAVRLHGRGCYPVATSRPRSRGRCRRSPRSAARARPRRAARRARPSAGSPSRAAPCDAVQRRAVLLQQPDRVGVSLVGEARLLLVAQLLRLLGE